MGFLHGEKILFYGTIAAMAVFSVGFLWGATSPANAAAFGLLPFGGRITSMQVCNEGFLAYLGPPSSFPILVPHGATYRENLIKPGGIVLGLAAGGSPCTVANTTVGAGARVLQERLIFIGTSL